tara:strand:+ start:3257 stop:3487 length:231 start_codon:yes stop_codon:yes gene_type:complete
MTNETTITQEQALNLLVQAVRVGQSKGAYSLEDASLLAQAIAVFTPPAEAKTEVTGTSTDTPAEATTEEVAEEAKS